MRHVFLPASIIARSQGMGDAATAARLVAPAGSSLRAVTCLLRTAIGAVDLSPVAAAADDHLGAAACAQEKTGRRSRDPLRTVGGMWTISAMAGILPPHACSARCGAWRLIRLGR